MCPLKFPSRLVVMDFPNGILEIKVGKHGEKSISIFYSILNRKCTRQMFACPDFISLLGISLNLTYFHGHTRLIDKMVPTSFLAKSYSRL
jgi:hypothetical protein